MMIPRSGSPLQLTVSQAYEWLFVAGKKERSDARPGPKEQGAVIGAKFVENHRHLFGCFGNNFRKESILTNFQEKKFIPKITFSL